MKGGISEFRDYAKARRFAGEAMGKSRKRSRHCNTGYPYNPIRVAHIHVVRPKVRHSTDSSLFIGKSSAWRTQSANLFCSLSVLFTSACYVSLIAPVCCWTDISRH